MDNDDWLGVVEDIEEQEHQLTAWERRFVTSIRDRIMDARTLTEPQCAKLDEIWDRVCG